MPGVDKLKGRFKKPAYRIDPLKLQHTGPTCVVEFADGVICRMTTYCRDDALDYERGHALCASAWQGKWKAQQPKAAPVEPAIGAEPEAEPAPVAKAKRKLKPKPVIEPATNQYLVRPEIERALFALMYTRPLLPAAPRVRSIHFERNGQRL